jgi:hypothetical protein
MSRPISRSVAVGVAAVGLAVTACAPPVGPKPPPPVPPQPTLTATAAWPMTETTGPMMDSVAPGQNGSVTAGVIRDGTTYYFPGWSKNVDANGNLFGSVPANTGQVVVNDPRHVLEPKNGKFKIWGVLQSQLAANGQLPTGVPGQNFNVIQKARSVDAGGFWKVEIGSNGNRRGKLMCTLGDGNTTVTAIAPPPLFANGTPHTFACWLNENTLVAELDGQAATADTSQVNNVDPSGRFSTVVTFGKKPGSTDPRDAFAGWLHKVSILVG